MTRVILGLIVLLFAGCASMHSQDSPDHSDKAMSAIASKDRQKITETIEMYFEGWMTGDTTKLGQAMHRTCQLKNIKDNDVVIYSRSTYLGFFKPRPRRENAGGSIISINVTDDIASAKCEIHTKDRLYTDYFNMMKLGERWYIVDKIAASKERTEK